MMHSKQIAIVFPKNNAFSSLNTKPVVMAALPYITESSLKKLILIISPYTNFSYNLDVDTCFIDENSSIKNKIYYKEVLQTLLNNKIVVVEVHQDAKLAGFLAKNLPHAKVCLIKHGDYFINKIKEKIFFYRWYYFHKYLKYITNVYCISNYVKNELCNAFEFFNDKSFVFYNSYGHINEHIVKEQQIIKENIILFAGKPVKNKGIIPLIKSIPIILKNNPNYNFVIMAGQFSSKDKYYKLFNNLINTKAIQKLIFNNRLKIYKAISVAEVFNIMKTAKVSIVPSIFSEPFGLVALESVMAKCLIVSSGSGGLKEITQDNALYLNKINTKEIILSVQKAIEILDNNYLVEKAYNYAINQFNPKMLVKKLDEHRIKLLQE
jgi:glycosyltransferase involved in cell wall biosynthesis